MLLWAQHILSAMRKCPEVVELHVTEIVYPSVRFEVTPATTWLEFTEHNSKFICKGKACKCENYKDLLLKEQ